MPTLPKSIEWVGDLEGHVALIDQTLLPEALRIIECRDAASVKAAIQRLAVRGAPAIGIAGAMGAVLGVRGFAATERTAFLAELDGVCADLAAARPTAVNLAWALGRMKAVAREVSGTVADIKERLLREAKAIRDEDARLCRLIGEFGEPLIPDGGGVLTYCNAGALATAEWGTALAPMYVAHERGRRFKVYAPETRPLLQGARLTAWELQRAGVDVTVVCDGQVASLMRSGRIDVVIVGADRIAANGDTANKIGTYGVACLAQAHGIDFYVAAPYSTFDLSISDGGAIPIEHRSPVEVSGGLGRRTVPEGVSCLNPAFDVTPAGLISGFITDRGLIHPVSSASIRSAMG